LSSTPTTVHQALARAAATWPDHAFIAILPETAGIYGIPAGETTYGAAGQAVARLAAAYATAGYGHGHRVGLLLENRPAFFIH